MDRFKYEPIDLEGHSFRLVQLSKGEDGPIQCELFHASLHDEENIIEYEALSYTWGGADKPYEVEINGRKMPVTENLYLALQHLRYQHQDRIVWIDAICIDQDNDKERGHQVRQMASIYKTAERVVIWLGRATFDTDLVMRYMQQLERETACNNWKASDKRWLNIWSTVQAALGNAHEDLMSRQQEGLMILLGRPWFKRVWIIQEIANARTAEVMCGTKSVLARTFSLMPSLMGITPDPHCQAVLDIMPGPTRKHSWWIQKRDLHTLLLKFQGSKASDPRDTIYALLGISSDGCGTDILVPNYEKTVEEVIHDTISFLLHFQGCESSTNRLPQWTLLEFLLNLDSLGNAVFVWAVEESHQNTVGDLVHRTDVDMDSQTRDGLTLLLQAVANGSDAIVKLLLENGAKVNAQGGQYGNALQAASWGGHKQIVRLLLDKGANVNAYVDGEYSNALQAASWGGNEQVVRLLLDEGADFNAQGHYLNTLQAALLRGDEQIAKLLLDKSRNVQGGPYSNPLQEVSYNGNERIVKLLLDNGVDVNMKGGRYGNALQAASYNGNERIVKLLLDNGVDVNMKGGRYGNALQAVLYNGNEQIVKLLLDKGVDVNVKGGRYGNALQAAVVSSNKQIVKLLLDKGAKVNAQGGHYGNPLQAAAAHGNEQIVKLLLDKGAKVNAQGGHYGNLLQAAVARDNEQIVKLLLDKGAKVDAQGGHYGNPLRAAVACHNEQTIKLLLENGARGSISIMSRLKTLVIGLRPT
jgi:ankyrin repeat protein